MQSSVEWSVPPGRLTPIVAFAGAVVLLVFTYRKYGFGLIRGNSGSGRLAPRPATPFSARYLYWIAGGVLAVAAAMALAQAALTEVSALLVLGGTLILIWALFKSGRDDAARWAVELLIVGSFLSMLLPYIKR
ncbi:MAG TPA: hypothetical protein VNK23_05065 [Candidatus Dormibacteraeota bacterium]|nr:hypothetical protein [Candidatus Dormibacteraeota bacterium]